jgi:hypothetical protein
VLPPARGRPSGQGACREGAVAAAPPPELTRLGRWGGPRRFTRRARPLASGLANNSGGPTNSRADTHARIRWT